MKTYGVYSETDYCVLEEFRMWWSLLGVVFGGLITVGTAILIENMRQPRITLKLSVPVDADYAGRAAPARRARFVNLELHNAPPPWIAEWMSRNAAIQSHGIITFHHLDGQNTFGRSMNIRWQGTPEPVPAMIRNRQSNRHD